LSNGRAIVSSIIVSQLEFLDLCAFGLQFEAEAKEKGGKKTKDDASVECIRSRSPRIQSLLFEITAMLCLYFLNYSLLVLSVRVHFL
jgi:hypothetical protein